MLEDDHANGGPHAAIGHGPGSGIGVKVHVTAGRGSPLEHFEQCQLGAVPDEITGNPTRFAGPDVLAQPEFQREIVCQAAEQRHGGMGMGVYQSRKQHVGGTVDAGSRRIGLKGRRTRQYGENQTVPNHHCVVFQDDPGRFNRDYPAGGDDEIGRVHAGRSGMDMMPDSVASRRPGYEVNRVTLSD